MKAAFAVITLLGALAAAAPAAVSPVYPTPQKCQLGTEYTRVTEVVIFPITSNERGKDDPSSNLPAKEGSYALRITPGKLEVFVHGQPWSSELDELGLYYAKQTVSQLLKDVPGAKDAQRDPFPDKGIEEVAKLGELPCGTILDWPDLAYRGTVEGYYGIPWGGEARMSQFAFYGRNKMNFYLYAPKDDPYHHGSGCYELYPAQQAAELKKQIDCARKNHVRFVWGIHPANTVNWNDNGGKRQLEGLCAKLQQLYDLGVRDFAVLVDDSGGEICKPERQVQLCNYILEKFIRTHKDVNQELVMCPTGYNRSWTNPQFLGTLGGGLDKDIHVMWTGDTVVHDITLSGQQWVHQALGRPTFIWWNWPCSDFKSSRLSMGRTYGNGQEPKMREEMTGFVANPMERAEASKVGLFGVADYTWNICGFDSENSWHQGIDRLYPSCADAMQVFCHHNSYLLPNNHGYFREESAGIADDAKAYTESVAAGKPDAAKAKKLLEEFAAINKAGKELRHAKGIESLQKDIAPWLEAFQLTGQAGARIIGALSEKEAASALESLLYAGNRMERINRMERTCWKNGSVGTTTGIEVAAYAMTPAIKETINFVNARVYSQLAGTNGDACRPVFTSSVGDAQKDAKNVADGDPKTLWHSGAQQKVGDWIGLDCGGAVDIRTVCLQMGGRYAKDFIPQGQMEYSLDNKDWKPLGSPTEGASVNVVNEKPVHARYVRYRALQAAPNWLSVCEFTVNRRPGTVVKTNIPGLAAASAYRDEKSVGINRIFEVAQIAPGQSICFELATPQVATWLEITLNNPDVDKWAKVELRTADGKYVAVKPNRQGGMLVIRQNGMPKEPVSGLRLTNAGNSTQDIKLDMFKLDMAPDDPRTNPDSLTDCDICSAFDLSRLPLNTRLAVPAKAKELLVIGTGDITVEGAAGAPKVKGPVRIYQLQPGKKHITIKAASQKDKVVNEVIFR